MQKDSLNHLGKFIYTQKVHAPIITFWVKNRDNVNMKTQKANGIKYAMNHILSYYDNPMYSYFASVIHDYITEKSQIDSLPPYTKYFARPCPLVPRHGFVDSRVVKSKAEIKKLFDEMKKQDPDSEMVLGPYFSKIDCSAILVNSGMLSVGPSNDGATAGRSSISFPVAPFKLPAEIMKHAKLKVNDTAYLETIKPNKKAWVLTQVRGGPAIDNAVEDFIPQNTKVKSIVYPINDLIKWESLAKTFGPGTVVYGNGHTLASHAAIHCILNNVPFVTSFKPRVGQTIKKIKTKEFKIDRDIFKKGVKAGLRMCSYENMTKLLHYAISVLHNWAHLRNCKHSSWILGSSSIIMAKICTTLVLGEHRHKSGTHSISRSKVYQSAMKPSISSFYKLPKVFEDFYKLRWSSGYGGIPWAICSWYSNNLWKSIVKSFNKKSDNLTNKEVSDIMGSINKVINLAHNNGWWFNKISEQSILDVIAKNPAISILCVTDLLFDINNKVRRAKSLEKEFRKTDITQKPFVKNKAGKIQCVKMSDVFNRSLYLWYRDEEGLSYNLCIDITPQEYKAICRFYKMRGIKLYKSITLKTVKNQFVLPGGRKLNLSKLFGVAA